MWRAFFCAIGSMLLIIGVEFLVIDSATWAAGPSDVPVASPGFFSSAPAVADRSFAPAVWMPWSALLTGGVVLSYALTLRRSQLPT